MQIRKPHQKYFEIQVASSSLIVLFFHSFRFGANTKICHFIGALKPWHHKVDEQTGKPMLSCLWWYGPMEGKRTTSSPWQKYVRLRSMNSLNYPHFEALV
mgnify:FL=1